MGAYEVFAYWNGSDIRTALEAVAAIMGGNDYLGLMKAIGLVGLLAAVTYALLSQRGQAAGSFFMGFVFVYACMFVPKVNVTVNDVRAPAVYVVANVPIGLAAPYATLSHMGHWLTMQYESRFTPLDDERFSKSGMVFGARVLETMAVQGFPDPALKADFVTFYKDCVVPELVDDPSKATAIRGSKDIAATIAPMLNPGRGTVLGTVSNMGSTAMACTDVISSMNSYIAATNAVNNAMVKIGRVVRADEGVTLSNPLLVNAVETDIDNMLGNMAGISDSAAQSLSQMMWINGVHDSDMALRNGYGSAQSTSYATAVTEQSARQNAYAGKLWAEKALPLIRNIAEFVLLASFPLVFIIMLLAGENALKGLKLYLVALASLSLWAPFTAILNGLVINNGKQALLAAKATAGGFTLDNLNGIIDLSLSQQALAGQLFLAVPLIAFAVVSASANATSSAVSSMTSPAASAAGQAGGQIAQGNLSAGQVAWRNTNALNTTANQSNTASSMSGGFGKIESGSGSAAIGRDAPGGGVFQARSSSLGAVSASAESAVESAFTKSHASSMSASRSSIAQTMDTIRQMQSNGARSENLQQAQKSFQAALGTDSSTQRAEKTAEGLRYLSQAGSDVSFTAGGRTAQQAGGSINLGIGGGSGGPGFGVRGGVDTTTYQDQSSKGGFTSQGGSHRGSEQSLQVAQGTKDSNTQTDTKTNSASQSAFYQSGLEKAKQSAQQGQAQAQSASQADERIQAVRSDKGGVRKDLANDIISGMGGQVLAQALFSQNADAFNAKAEGLAMQYASQKGLGPGASTQLSGVSGSQAVNGAQVDAANSALQQRVGSEISGAPTSAQAPSQHLPMDTPVGSGPLRGQTADNPFTSNPSSPDQPHHAIQAGHQADGVKTELSNTRASIMRDVGKATEAAKEGGQRKK